MEKEVTVRYTEPSINIFIQKRVTVKANTVNEAIEILKSQFGNDASFIFKKN
jgi:hypothetical protein